MNEFQRILTQFAQENNIPVEELKANIMARDFSSTEAADLLYFQEDPNFNPFLLLMTKYYEQCPNLRDNANAFSDYGLYNQLVCLYFGLVNLGEKKDLAIDFGDVIKRLDENLAAIIANDNEKLADVKSQIINTYKYSGAISAAHFDHYSEIEPRIIGLCYKEIVLEIIDASEEEKEKFLDQEVRLFFPGAESDKYNLSLLEGIDQQQKYLIDEVVNRVLENFDRNEVNIYDLLETINEQLFAIEEAFDNLDKLEKQNTSIQLVEQQPQKGFDFPSIEKYLKENIIGQERQIEQFLRRLQVLDFAGIKETGAKGVFLFAGPTGVGKTELAKLTSKHTNYPLIRMDMSEYKESHSVSKIYGSPPGYVGYDEKGNKVFDQIKQTPQSIVLLDEIEKAHPRVLDTFLHIFDEGKACDNRQNEIDFSETIFVLTTNIGAFEASKNPIGFNNVTNYDEVYEDAIEERLLPEFINRLDEVIYFQHLQKEDIYEIIDLSLNKISQKFWERGYQYDFQMQPAAAENLVAEINYEKYGARDVFRVVSDRIIPGLINLDIETKEAQINIDFHEDFVITQTQRQVKRKQK